MADMEQKIAEFQQKIKKEKMVLDGAMKMLQAQTSPAAKSMTEMSIIESRHRIEFLEGELRKLSLKKLSEVRSSTAGISH
jgi:classical protein kinase C/novel protein kinase C epsilon type